MLARAVLGEKAGGDWGDRAGRATMACGQVADLPGVRRALALGQIGQTAWPSRRSASSPRGRPRTSCRA